MNFQELLQKMQQLDQPVETTTEMGCGDSPMPGPGPSSEPPVSPPSMSINLNAQGMDNIEDLMKLVTKVNPDMDKPGLPPLPSMGSEPSIMSIKPSMPPLKMLPDLDADNDEMPGGEKDHMGPDGDEGPEIKGLDRDSDGDHDMDDHDAEKKDEKEGFGNSPLGSQDEPEVKDFKSAMPDGNDLNKPKKSFSDKPYRGDNPMSTESTDLRAQIRADLQRRLNEAKKS